MEFNPIEQLRRILEAPLERNPSNAYSFHPPESMMPIYPNNDPYMYNVMEEEQDYDGNYIFIYAIKFSLISSNCFGSLDQALKTP